MSLRNSRDLGPTESAWHPGSGRGPLLALLGPTNTGKTHRAVERMLEHNSGMIGLPLRLLAREVYDRISSRLGEQAVALVTGEEKRVPHRPQFWVCTVVAMPQDREVDFLAVDEIQLAAHPERGHVFTDRLLRARGRLETWFMGSDTIRPLVQQLLPTLRIETHPRLSRLRAVGSSSLRTLPPRSAVVAFSAAQVYEIAERIRQLRGGAAVVLGALSPRTRNAQVALYQAGEVDYLVATDAIGMGLNMDVEHVAFAATTKFDGRETRPLDAAELAQIAGRAGRYLTDGTFGTLTPHPTLPMALSQAIEMHRFSPHRFIWWRNSDLDTRSLPLLLSSLRRHPRCRELKRVEHSQDVDALAFLSGMDEICRRAKSAEQIRLLWEVCQIPDFGNVTIQHHSTLLSAVFRQLSDRGILDPIWLEGAIDRIDDAHGDIDTLMMRIEMIRTFTYIAHHPRWVDAAEEWQARTQAVEERLGDALHERLVERFVEPGHAARPRARKRARQSAQFAEPERDGGFGKAFSELRLMKDKLRLKLKLGTVPEPVRGDSEAWAHELADAPYSAFRLDAAAHLWAEQRHLGRLTRGTDRLHPEVKLILNDEVGAGARAQLQRRLVAWSRDAVANLFAPLRSERSQAFSASARGLLYQLEQGLGTLLATDARTQVDALSRRDREICQELGVVIGSHHVFLLGALNPEATECKLALIRAWESELARSALPELPAAGQTAWRVGSTTSREHCLAMGYPVLGDRAVRADVLERVSRCLRLASGSGEFEFPGEIALWLDGDQSSAQAVAKSLGYRLTTPGGQWVGPARASGRRRRRKRVRRAAVAPR